jgi:virulence-associated protein VapD
MAEVLNRCGVKREDGYLYFINKTGDVARVKMARKGQKVEKKQEVVAKCGIKREQGYLYFVDKNGNAARTKMARGRK